MGKKINIQLNKQSFIVILLLAVVVFFVGSFTEPGKNLPKDRNLQFHAIDVKHGDSFLFQLPSGENILVDSGTRTNSKYVVKYLKRRKVNKIDLLVATHPHADHIGGMRNIIDNFSIGTIWDSGFNHGSHTQMKFYKKVKENNISFLLPKRGYKCNIGDAELSVLGPAKLLKGTHSDPNNNCIVFLLRYGNVSFLMTGDMERAERETISPLPRCTVLKMAHHGSYNGVSKRMIEETQPKIAIFSYAKENSYNLPSRKTIKLMEKYPEIIKLSTTKGDIVITTNGTSVNYPESKRM